MQIFLFHRNALRVKDLPVREQDKLAGTISGIRTTLERQERYEAALAKRGGRDSRGAHTRLIEDALDAYLDGADDEFGPLSPEDRDLLRVGREFRSKNGEDLGRILLLLFAASERGFLDAILAPAEALARIHTPPKGARSRDAQPDRRAPGKKPVRARRSGKA